jgi:hypothetical protein
MSPKKGAGKPDGANTPKKNKAGKMTAGSPVAKRDRRRAPVANSGRAVQDSLTGNMVADERKSEDSSSDSDDGKQLSFHTFSHHSSVIPCPQLSFHTFISATA